MIPHRTSSLFLLFTYYTRKERDGFKIVLKQGMDGYIVAHCPALKRYWLQGKTEEETITNIKEAIKLYLDPNPVTVQLSSNKYKIPEVGV